MRLCSSFWTMRASALGGMVTSHKSSGCCQRHPLQGPPQSIPSRRAQRTVPCLCRDAVKAGKIDGLASDHSPCPPDMKELESGNFMKAWGGIAGQSLLCDCPLGSKQRAGHFVDCSAHVLCQHVLWQIIGRLMARCSHLRKSGCIQDSGSDRGEACRLAVWPARHLERHAKAQHDARGPHAAVEHACGQAGGDAGAEGIPGSGHGCRHSGEGLGSTHIRCHCNASS